MAGSRVTARVLPLSTDGAVLLLEERDPAEPELTYWSSIGGAVEPGESLEQAAVREMGEETGIVVGVDDLVGPVHQHTNSYSWNGVRQHGDHTYFTIRLPREVAISFDRLEPEEVGNVLRAAWLLPDEVATCRPPQLVDIVRTAVAAMEEQP